MNTTMREERYIPGFDWIKLLGCIIVARFHILESVAETGIQKNFFLSTIGSVDVVGFFFLMSSFLLGSSLIYKNNPLEYLKKYVVKYFSIYYIFLIVWYVYSFGCAFLTSGYSKWLNVIFFFITEPLMLWNANQLWFLPPLLISCLLYGLCIILGKKKLFNKIIWFVLPGFLVVYGLSYLYEMNYMQGAFQTLLECVIKSLTYYLRGMIFVWLGMKLAELKSNKVQLRFMNKYLILLILYTAFLFLMQNNINQLFYDTVCKKYLSIGWTCILFIGILKMKGQFLYPYHRFISIFSIGCFFDHIILNVLLKYFINSREVRFLMVLVLNVIFTEIIIYARDKSKRRLIEETA